MSATVFVVLVFPPLSRVGLPADGSWSIPGLDGQETNGFTSGQEWHTTTLDKAPVLNEKNWFCSPCETSHVWTRKKCRSCDEGIPTWLFRFHQQASEEQQCVRHESSAIHESIGTMATENRIAAQRDRKQREESGKVGGRTVNGSNHFRQACGKE